jgi:hypothetical protein
LLHQLTERIDPRHRPLFITLLTVKLVQTLTSLGNLFPLRCRCSLDLGPLQDDLTHLRRQVRCIGGTRRISDPTIPQHLIPLPLQILIRLIRIGL